MVALFFKEEIEATCNSIALSMAKQNNELSVAKITYVITMHLI